MKALFKLIIASLLILTAASVVTYAWAQQHVSELPKPVQKTLKRAESCRHFMMQEGLHIEHKNVLNHSVDGYRCWRLQGDIEKLKKDYAKDDGVTAKLNHAKSDWDDIWHNPKNQPKKKKIKPQKSKTAEQLK